MVTPVRRQYLDIKNAYPDALVLFRLGDFYEAFDDDARVASRELEITLTSRSMGKNLKIPMAGVPAHALESYLVRLIKKGYKVAICEQLSDPATSKGLLDRMWCEWSLREQFWKRLCWTRRPTNTGRGSSGGPAGWVGLRGRQHRRVRHHPDYPR